MKRFWTGVTVVALLVLGYKWGQHVQASADAAVMQQHLADDSLDSETIWEICMPRPAIGSQGDR